MTDDHAALIALLRTRPDGLSWRHLTDEVLEHGSAAAVWDTHIPPSLIPCPQDTGTLEAARADLDMWRRNNLRFLAVSDPDFPQRLLDIVETPPFLFAQGTMLPTDPGMSVVGSRNASDRGIAMATHIARYLTTNGLTVISGLAKGIDTAAHTATLDAGGRTVAFIATGLNQVYPPVNRQLQSTIAERGLVLSQFFPDAGPQKHTFLMRNALMSGYGLATIVVEAGENSGARAQARMAVNHGRPVILTDIVVERNTWARALTDNSGVHVVSGLADLEPIINEILSEPDRVDDALKQLAF